MKTINSFILLVCALWSAASCLSGCSPTYPKELFRESIVKVCKKEYNLDVKAETIGKTIAIYVPLENLIDFTFSITVSASEKINNVILSVSRVALSSNADYDFYCIIAHDIRIPEIQIVIIKSVSDVKRFLLSDISRGEYSKRMLVDIRLSPQSQKERAIKDVFEKMSLDNKWQEQVMNDFFRSEPTALGDIGYWNGRFYIKDVSMPEFLAEQIANRVRIEFREDRKISKAFSLKSSKGSYISKDAKRHFEFEIAVEPKWFDDLEGAAHMEIGQVFQSVGRLVYHVLHGYRFEDFDYAEIRNMSDGNSLRIGRDDLKRFKPKNAKIEDIVPLDMY